MHGKTYFSISPIPTFSWLRNDYPYEHTEKKNINTLAIMTGKIIAHTTSHTLCQSRSTDVGIVEPDRGKRHNILARPGDKSGRMSAIHIHTAASLCKRRNIIDKTRNSPASCVSIIPIC